MFNLVLIEFKRLTFGIHVFVGDSLPSSHFFTHSLSHSVSHSRLFKLVRMEFGIGRIVTRIFRIGTRIAKQAQLGVPHSRIQVELGFILQAGTCQILNFAQNPRQSHSVQGTKVNHTTSWLHLAS